MKNQWNITTDLSEDSANGYLDEVSPFLEDHLVVGFAEKGVGWG